MSICPKNKSSKGRRNRRRAKLENVCSEPCKMQQMWCSYDASQEYVKPADLYNKKEIVSAHAE